MKINKYVILKYKLYRKLKPKIIEVLIFLCFKFCKNSNILRVRPLLKDTGGYKDIF